MSTQFTRRIIVVVSEDRRSAANDKAKEVVGQRAGEQTWTVGLVPAGSAPGAAPTHRWCSWQMTESQFSALDTKLASLPDASTKVRMFRIFEDPYTPEQVLAELGLERWQPEAPA